MDAFGLSVHAWKRLQTSPFSVTVMQSICILPPIRMPLGFIKEPALRVSSKDQECLIFGAEGDLWMSPLSNSHLNLKIVPILLTEMALR